MQDREPAHIVVVGAGAAGLMAARELACAGRRVTVLEARDRLGGRIYALPVAGFGYPVEGGAEFVHGAAPVTRQVMREAGLALAPRHGTRWSTRSGVLRPDDSPLPDADRFYRALTEATEDMPIAEFLEAHFADPRYDALRRSVIRTVEGYDAADPHRFSTFALREEWMARDDGEHGRLRDGYGALIAFLAAECHRHGAVVRLGAAVAAIERETGRLLARCHDGEAVEADAAILTVPPPLLSEIALPPSARERAQAAADIGFGNVVKILLRFALPWWATPSRTDRERPESGGGRTNSGGRDLADLSFLLSNARVPTWWTQYPALYPVLTGWFAGPKADAVSAMSESDLVEMGLASLAEIFDLPADRLRNNLVASRAINWGNDPFARGAYSYATPKTRAALSVLRRQEGDAILFSGEALYAGPDMGTVEAALASGEETARTILREVPGAPARTR